MPGMTSTAAYSVGTASVASMRPRLNAGDDDPAVNSLALNLRASMRPRLNAGDDTMSGHRHEIAR